MSNKILLVEDDATYLLMLQDVLQLGGFEVITACDGEDGLKRFNQEGADLIVCDVMMPRMNGFKMAEEIRKKDERVPILFLTAKSDIDSVERGFDIGCIDYLKKPFDIDELLIRVKAYIKRNQPQEIKSLSVGKHYVFDTNLLVLKFTGKADQQLSVIEAKLLTELVQNAEKTLSLNTLTMLVWKRDDASSRNSLHGYICKLRMALEHDPEVAIISVRGLGYMLTLDAKRARGTGVGVVDADGATVFVGGGCE